MTDSDRDFPPAGSGSTPWERRSGNDADSPDNADGPADTDGDREYDQDATTVVHRDDLADAGRPPSAGATPATTRYPANQDVEASSADSASPTATDHDSPTEYHASTNQDYGSTSAAGSSTGGDAGFDLTKDYATSQGFDDGPHYGSGQDVGATQTIRATSAAPGYQPAPGDGASAPGTFFAQPPQSSQVELAPAKSRVLQNIAGVILGLVLTLGPVILYSVLKGDAAPFTSTSVGNRFLLLGIVVIAAIPAFLAGWAPAAAWLPGVIFAILGTIAWFSTGFRNWLDARSVDWFRSDSVAQFIFLVALPLGFALLFAGLGTVWARRAGVHSVLNRLGHW